MKWLRDMSHDDLRYEMWSSAFPKWATLCCLKLAGLPVLDAGLIPPEKADEEDVKQCVDAFADRLGIDRVLIRSDGGVETGSYFRGGSSLDPADAVDVCVELIRTGRAVVLMEPTNRFTNRFSANVCLDQHGPMGGHSVTFDILGGGYNASDMNRGGILPQYVIRYDVEDWDELATPRLWSMSASRYLSAEDEDRRRGRRMELARQELEVSGVPVGSRDFEDGLAAVARTLESAHTDVPDSLLMTLCGHARAIVATALGAWQRLCASMSILDDGRMVFWDIVDGANKYAIGGVSN